MDACRRVVLTLALLVAGCGGSSSPTSPTPQVVQVAGLRRITETLTSVSGGECFASTFQGLVGTSGEATLQVTQSGSSLQARATDNATGASCDYVGTAGAASFALNTSACTASDVIGAACANGARRDIRLQTGGYNGSISGGTATGTGAQTYNIVVSGTSSPVGTLTLTSRFTATRN
jgi:hypothetical protein